jgi:predicted RecA/RadA family phage recombinase
MSLKNYQSDPHTVDYTPSAAVTAGDAIQLPDGTVGISNNDIAASALGALQIGGIAKVSAASATTWSDGDDLWYDVSATNAVKKSLTLDGSTDFYLGVAVGAKVSGTTVGYVRINQSRPSPDPIVFEFDCQTGVDTDPHVLIPAEMNPNGLLILGVYAVVTEQFAGTEDQGIVTVSDESDNAIATLTASDAGADAVNDIIVGYSAPAASTGDAAKIVAAGEFVDAAVTQVTTGSAAGKMKVYVQAVPLV